MNENCHTLVTFKFDTTTLPLQIMVTLLSQSIPVMTKASAILGRNIKKKTGMNINVQADIEKTQVHILTKNLPVVDQLLHSSTRLECIKGLEIELDISNGHKIIDKLRFFMEMTPAHNLMLGNKKEVITFAQYAQSKQHRHIVYKPSFLLK